MLKEMKMPNDHWFPSQSKQHFQCTTSWIKVEEKKLGWSCRTSLTTTLIKWGLLYKTTLTLSWVPGLGLLPFAPIKGRPSVQSFRHWQSWKVYTFQWYLPPSRAAHNCTLFVSESVLTILRREFSLKQPSDILPFAPIKSCPWVHSFCQPFH